MKYGYARISTPKQSLENQIALLKENGCEKIFFDIISGSVYKRPQFDRMMEEMRAQDILLVTGIDRLGRTTKDLAIFLEQLHTQEIELMILGYDIDTRSSTGRMIFNFMAMIAENERMRNLERIRQGIEGARKRGKVPGRPFKMDPKKAQRMIDLYQEKRLSIKEICLMYQISKVTFYNYLKRKQADGNS